MRRARAAFLLLPFLLLGWMTAAPARADDSFVVDLDRTSVAARLGERFSITSTIHRGGGTSTDAVAHLNVLSLDPDVYVDPEDWSADRTRYLGPLSAASATPVTWDVQAVNSGRILIYVTVTEPGATDTVHASPALRLEVAPQARLTGAGALPLAVGVPGALLVLTGLVSERRRRRLRPRQVATHR